jgi:streptogramin lyase
MLLRARFFALAAVALVALALPAAAAAKPGDILIGDYDAAVNGSEGAVFSLDGATLAVTTLAAAAPFEDPLGIALERNGSIVVADDDALPAAPAAGAVLRVNPFSAGSISGVASGGPFRNPKDIAVEPSGKLIVVDPDGGSGPGAGVFRVDPVSGAIATLAEGPPLEGTYGVRVAPSGQIYAANRDAATIHRIDPVTGAVSALAAGPPLLFPVGVTVAPDGNLIVTDNGVPGVFRVDVRTGAVTPITTGGLLNTPSGVALAPNGQILLADEDVGIIRVDPATGAQTLLRNNGAPLANPYGIEVVPPKCGGKNATIVGSTRADRITGSAFADVIVALGGKDRVNGGKGKDLICGGGGRDILKGGAGKDRLLGQGGRDVCAGGKARDSGRSCERGKL